MYLIGRTEHAELTEKISKAIHLEEWCPERERCRGTSGASYARARAAMKVLEEAGIVAIDPEAP